MIATVIAAAGVLVAYLAWRRPHRMADEGKQASPSQRETSQTSTPGEELTCAPVPLRELPREPSWFTGRTAELNQLLSMLPDPERSATVVISAIDGMAGIVKPVPGKLTQTMI